MTPTPPCAAGSTPMIVSGATRASSRRRTPQAARDPSSAPQPPSPRHPAYRRRGHPGRRGLGHRVARPFPGSPSGCAAASDKRVRDPPDHAGRPERDGPRPGAAGRRARWCSCGPSPTTASSPWSGWRWPRAVWWRRPPTGSAGLRSISMIASDGRSYRASLVGVDDVLRHRTRQRARRRSGGAVRR